MPHFGRKEPEVENLMFELENTISLTKEEPLFETMAILGLGLIGGSFALAAHKQRMARNIVAFDPNIRHLAQASTNGVIEQGFSNVMDAVKYADAVILAAPVCAILDLLSTITPYLQPNTFVMDLGSTKSEIVMAMDELPAHICAIGGHPMAGKELSGYTAAEATLFEGATFALCPSIRTTPTAHKLAERIVKAIGAHPLFVDAATHDAAVARISHLPYLLSATLAYAASPQGLSRQLAASGYRDTSRLSGSDPTMMLNILLTNAAPIRAALADSRAALDRLDQLLLAGNESGLRAWMDEARARR